MLFFTNQKDVFAGGFVPNTQVWWNYKDNLDGQSLACGSGDGIVELKTIAELSNEQFVITFDMASGKFGDSLLKRSRSGSDSVMRLKIAKLVDLVDQNNAPREQIDSDKCCDLELSTDQWVMLLDEKSPNLRFTWARAHQIREGSMILCLQNKVGKNGSNNLKDLLAIALEVEQLPQKKITLDLSLNSSPNTYLVTKFGVLVHNYTLNIPDISSIGAVSLGSYLPAAVGSTLGPVLAGAGLFCGAIGFVLGFIWAYDRYKKEQESRELAKRELLAQQKEPNYSEYIFTNTFIENQMPIQRLCEASKNAMTVKITENNQSNPELDDIDYEKLQDAFSDIFEYINIKKITIEDDENTYCWLQIEIKDSDGIFSSPIAGFDQNGNLVAEKNIDKILTWIGPDYKKPNNSQNSEQNNQQVIAGGDPQGPQEPPVWEKILKIFKNIGKKISKYKTTTTVLGTTVLTTLPWVRPFCRFCLQYFEHVSGLKNFAETCGWYRDIVDEKVRGKTPITNETLYNKMDENSSNRAEREKLIEELAKTKEALIGANEKIINQSELIIDQKKQLENKDKQLENKDKQLENKDKQLENKDKQLENKDKQIKDQSEALKDQEKTIAFLIDQCRELKKLAQKSSA